MKRIACLLFAACVFIHAKVEGQSCAACKRVPKVCHYDFFVLEKKPEDPAKVAEWLQLFWLAKFSQSYISSHNKNCVRFIDPIASRAQGNQTILVGITEPVLPPGKIQSGIDYIIMGGVIKSGDSYLLQMNLQTACTQETIAKSEVTFQLTADESKIQSIAEQAAAKLCPLEEKINSYAEKKRRDDKNTAFGSWGAESISVVPKTTKLASGQETEVEITLKDCDGTPLAGREVSFGKGVIQGFDIKGTTGGTVTPSKVITDGSGKAKVKFKMGSTKSAFIRAHYLFNRPSGCQDAMIGSAPIGGIPVKVVVFYETDQEQSMNPEMFSPIIKSAKTKEKFSRSLVTELYHYPKDPKSGYLVAAVPDPEAGESIYEMDLGDFTYTGKFPAVKFSVESGPIKVEQLMQRDSMVSNSGHTTPKKPTDIVFYLGSEFEPMYFSMDFNCQNEEDENEIGTGPFPGSISVNKNDFNVKFTSRKITDPKSPYKMEYKIEMLRDPGSLKEVSELVGKDLTGLQEISGYHGEEVMAVFIYSPYGEN